MEREMGSGGAFEAPEAVGGFGAWSYLSPATESDSDLMKRAKQGNRTAFGILFGRLSARLWSLAYLTLHDAGAADEIVHKTFVLGMEELAACPDDGEPAAWFCGLALGLCRSALREAGTGPPPAKPAATHGTVVLALHREAARRLAVALGFLGEKQREAFLLRYVEGLTYDEVASILGVDVAEARLLGQQARVALKENFGRDFMQTAIAS